MKKNPKRLEIYLFHPFTFNDKNWLTEYKKAFFFFFVTVITWHIIYYNIC